MASFILWIFITFYLWVTVRVIVSRVNHIFSIFYSSWLSGIGNALKVSVLSPELPSVYASIITGLISLSIGGSEYIVLLMLCHLSKNIYRGLNPRNVQISVLLQSKYLANTLNSGYERNTFFFWNIYSENKIARGPLPERNYCISLVVMMRGCSVWQGSYFLPHIFGPKPPAHQGFGASCCLCTDSYRSLHNLWNSKAKRRRIRNRMGGIRVQKG